MNIITDIFSSISLKKMQICFLLHWFMEHPSVKSAIRLIIFFYKDSSTEYQNKIVEVYSLMILSLDSKNDKVSVTVGMNNKHISFKDWLSKKRPN